MLSLVVGLIGYGMPVLDLPDNIPAPKGWSELSACKGESIELFYPKSGRRPTRALAICSSCEVREECLEYALTNHQHWGVWGGMTERQRFEEKRRRRQ
jgi:WhiB family redox-sensing transcriptional regulator